LGPDYLKVPTAKLLKLSDTSTMDLICMYVFRGDEEFGESIDVYGDYLIVKVGSEFLAVPKKCIKSVDGDKIVVSEFDEEEAAEVGKKWVEEKSKPVSLEELKSYGFGEEQEE